MSKFLHHCFQIQLPVLPRVCLEDVGLVDHVSDKSTETTLWNGCVRKNTSHAMPHSTARVFFYTLLKECWLQVYRTGPEPYQQKHTHRHNHFAMVSSPNHLCLIQPTQIYPRLMLTIQNQKVFCWRLLRMSVIPWSKMDSKSWLIKGPVGTFKQWDCLFKLTQDPDVGKAVEKPGWNNITFAVRQ